MTRILRFQFHCHVNLHLVASLIFGAFILPFFLIPKILLSIGLCVNQLKNKNVRGVCLANSTIWSSDVDPYRSANKNLSKLSVKFQKTKGILRKSFKDLSTNLDPYGFWICTRNTIHTINFLGNNEKYVGPFPPRIKILRESLTMWKFRLLVAIGNRRKLEIFWSRGYHVLQYSGYKAVMYKTRYYNKYFKINLFFGDFKSFSQFFKPPSLRIRSCLNVRRKWCKSTFSNKKHFFDENLSGVCDWSIRMSRRYFQTSQLHWILWNSWEFLENFKTVSHLEYSGKVPQRVITEEHSVIIKRSALHC